MKTPVPPLMPDNQAHQLGSSTPQGSERQEETLTKAALLERCAQRFKEQAEWGEEIEPWRIELARDLNRTVWLVRITLEMDGCEWDIEHCAAALRLIDRVAEFEEIQVLEPRRRRKQTTAVSESAPCPP